MKAEPIANGFTMLTWLAHFSPSTAIRWLVLMCAPHIMQLCRRQNGAGIEFVWCRMVGRWLLWNWLLWNCSHTIKVDRQTPMKLSSSRLFLAQPLNWREKVWLSAWSRGGGTGEKIFGTSGKVATNSILRFVYSSFHCSSGHIFQFPRWASLRQTHFIKAIRNEIASMAVNFFYVWHLDKLLAATAVIFTLHDMPHDWWPKLIRCILSNTVVIRPIKSSDRGDRTAKHIASDDIKRQ